MSIVILSFLLVFFGSLGVHAQFKDIDKRIENKVKTRAERKVDRTIDKALDKTEQKAEEAARGDGKKPSDRVDKEIQETNNPTDQAPDASSVQQTETTSSFQAYAKFDFKAGDKIVFFDDFSQDNPGDFPAKWNGNGAGEVVTTTEERKSFELKGGSFYLPQLSEPLAENYTLEFDLNTSSLDQKLSSNAFMQIVLDDNDSFTIGKSFTRVRIPFCQYISVSIQVESRAAGKEVINNKLAEDTRKKIKAGTHISIAVNKKRFRLWLDEQKVIDIPTLVPENAKHLKLTMQGFNEDFKKYKFYISNVKIAEGAADLRSKLLSEGKFVTTGILFDSNSEKIKPESHGVLKEIAKVLQENESVRVKVIGHTDADGEEKSNLDLSIRRALSVKTALVKEFGISESRFETAGKGEKEPAVSTNTPEGKANNRRVEFIKI